MTNRIITISFHLIVEDIRNKSSPSPVGVRRGRVGRFYKEVDYNNTRKPSGEPWLWSEIFCGTASACSLEAEKPLLWDNFAGGCSAIKKCGSFLWFL